MVKEINKKKLIDEIIRGGRERGIEVNPGYLKNLPVVELKRISKTVKEGKIVVRKGAIEKNIVVPSIEKEKKVKKVKRDDKLPEGKVSHHGVVLNNPFKLPIGMNIEEATKWATEHVDILNSPEYRKWKRTPEGKRTMRYGGLEVPLGAVEDVIVNFNAREIKAKRRIEDKAGKINSSTSRPKTLAELAKRIKKIEERVKKIEAKEKEVPGYMYLRREALKRMKETREKYKKNRRH